MNKDIATLNYASSIAQTGPDDVDDAVTMMNRPLLAPAGGAGAAAQSRTPSPSDRGDSSVRPECRKGGMGAGFADGKLYSAQPHHSVTIEIRPETGSNSLIQGFNGLGPWSIGGTLVIKSDHKKPRQIYFVDIQLQIGIADTMDTSNKLYVSPDLMQTHPRIVVYEKVIRLSEAVVLEGFAEIRLPFRFDLTSSYPASMDSANLHPSATQFRYELTTSVKDDTKVFASNYVRTIKKNLVVPSYTIESMRKLVAPSVPAAITSRDSSGKHEATFGLPDGGVIGPLEEFEVTLDVQKVADSKSPAKIQTISLALVEKYDFDWEAVGKVALGHLTRHSEGRIVLEVLENPKESSFTKVLRIPRQQPSGGSANSKQEGVNVDGVYEHMRISHVLRCIIKFGGIFGKEFVLDLPVTVVSCGRAMVSRLVETYPDLLPLITAQSHEE